MATANELFLDALIRRAIYLQQFSKGLGRRINSLLNDTEADVRHQIEQRLADIAATGIDYGPMVTSRLQVLQASLQEIRGAAFDDASLQWDTELQALAHSEG